MADKSDPDPAVESALKTHRLALVFDHVRNGSRVKSQVVHNRSVDPARLPPGTCAVSFHERLHVNVNGQKILGPIQKPSSLIMIAEKIFMGCDFRVNMAEVAQTLNHNGVRPVIELPPYCYNYNSEDLSGQYKIVPPGVEVISTQGERLWPPKNDPA